MGIFTLPVETVTNVRIYGSPSEEDIEHQVTVISQTIRNLTFHNKVIIPVPYPETVKIQSNQDGLLFLEKLEGAFDPSRPRSSHQERPPPFPPHEQRSLPRAQYEVDFIGTFQKLLEFNEEYQIAHPRLLARLGALYREPYWGFLVLGVHEGHHVYEPLIYTHRMLREKLFFPLIHHYPNDIHDIHLREESHDWDHTVFINGTYLQTMREAIEVNPMRLCQVPWDVLPRKFQVPLRHLLLREFRANMYANMDYLAPSRLHEQSPRRFEL